MPRHQDVGWEHGKMIGEKRYQVQCNYCQRITIGGITRFKEHLASKRGEIKGCSAVPKDVRDIIRKQLATLKQKKGTEKKPKREGMETSMLPSSGNQIIDSNACDSVMNPRLELLGSADLEVQALVPASSQLLGTAEISDAFSNPSCDEQGSAPRGATDVGWAHGSMVNGDRQKIMCKYCQKTILGGGISRLKQHLAGERGNIAPCEKVPYDVKAQIQQHLGFKVLEKIKRQKESEDIKTSLEKARDEKNNGVFSNEIPARTHTRRRAKEVHDGSYGKRIQNVVSSEVSNLTFASQESIEQADIAVAKFLFVAGIAGIPFSSVNSSYFQQMADKIAAVGPGYKMPSYYSLRGKLLDKCMTEVGDLCKEIRRSWEATGCTIMVDRWIDKIGRAMISFFAYSPKGNVFLKSVEAIEYENSSEALLSLFDSTIQEVGPRNVIAFLTDISPCHRAAAKVLMNKYRSFFSCICANHCIDLMLNVIAEMDAVKEVLAKVKKICQLIYNNVWILNLLRKKTDGSEIFRPAATKFVTIFSTLQSMTSLRDPLLQVFLSTSWQRSVLSKHKLGSEVMDILLDIQFWPSCFRILKVVNPLIEVIHLVDSEERPGMGYFYDAVEKARKGIILAFENKESDYSSYLDAIDRIREEIHSPLHAAAYYLNPCVYYNSGFSMSNVIQKGLLDCIETLEANILSQDNITRQKSLYEDAVGDFSRPVALRGRESLSAATWWSLYGSDCPDLRRFAIRILSQTCVITSQRDLIMNEYMHVKHMNKLENERMNDFTAVHYNLWVQQRQSVTSSGSKTFIRGDYDPLCFDGLNAAAGDLIENAGAVEPENNSWRNLVLPVDLLPTKNKENNAEDNNLSTEDGSNYSG